MAVAGRKRNRPDDWEELEPSPVIHIRELPEHTLEIDLIRAFERFGRVRDVSMIPNRGQALLEFEDIRSSEEVLASMDPINVANRRVKVNYSTSQRIVHRTGPGEQMDGSGGGENRILLLTVYNSHYPITVDVIKQIASTHGRVLRIVIFKKSHVQAMVEFETIEDARRAKKHLNGADIYSGCCTLKVEYARPTRLSVTRNDQDSWDYETPPDYSSDIRATQVANSLLGTPGGGRGNGMMSASGHGAGYPDMVDRYGGRSGNQSAADYGRGDGGRYDVGRSSNGNYLLGSGPGTGYPRGGAGAFPGAALSSGPMSQMMGALAATSLANNDVSLGQSGTCVAMVYGLNMSKINCDRLFNSFCIYGNVVRVKFLHSKEGACMVQMGDGLSVDRLISNMSGAVMFEKKIQIQPSKQKLILDVQQPYELPDGSPSFRDYTGSRNNRYVNVEMAAKNRICQPTKTLHYWNCPPNFTEEEMRDVFRNASAPVPEAVLIFSNREKSSSGLLEWSCKEDAMDSLCTVNHTSIEYKDAKFPYLLKVSFSSAPIKERMDRGAGRPRQGGDEQHRDRPRY